MRGEYVIMVVDNLRIGLLYQSYGGAVMTAFGYIRVSTATQAEKGYGLDTQRNAIQEYCKQHNLELLEIFVDAGISGTTTVETEGEELISKRTGLLQLLSALDGTKRIVVLNTSRLWRSQTAAVLIKREIIKRQGVILSIEQPNYNLYTTDPNDFLLSGMMELLDQYDRMSIALKLARGRTTKAMSGDKPAGRMPYGYAYTSDKKGVCIVPEQAETVRQIYDAASNGMTLDAIAKQLNDAGRVTATGRAWSKQGVSVILHNPFYKGVLVHQHKHIQGNHQPIISADLWDMVQQKR